MDIPSFRYLEDAVKTIKQISEKVSELSQVFKAKKKMLASLITADTEEFSINYKPRKKDLKLIPESSKVVVPGGIKKLQSQYDLLEELNDQYQALDAIGSQIEVQFRGNRDLKKATTELQVAKKKIQDQMQEIFMFLHSVAKSHVPESFNTYVEAVNYELSNHVAFASSQSFLYVSVSDEGSMVFTNYTVLADAANADGELATLYVAVQWDMGRANQRSKIQVYLDHDYELPNRLAKAGTGTEVQNVQQAVRAIAQLLEIENFSSSLGIIPLTLQLKMNPNALKSELFSYKEYISKVEVSDVDSSLVFTTRQDSGVTEELAKKIAQQLFLEVRGIIKKSQGAKMRTQVQRAGRVFKIKFSMHGIAGNFSLDLYDIEFLRDKFGLTEAQLQKIARIINKG